MSKGTLRFILFLVFNYIILVFVVDYGSSDDSTNYQSELSILKDKNKQLKAVNTKMGLEIMELEKSNVNLLSELKVEKGVTIQIKTKRDEKVDDISGMDNNELYGFFSNIKTDSINGQIRY